MSTENLFPPEAFADARASREEVPADDTPRVVTADRRQVRLQAVDLDSLLPQDHVARAIWAVVERLDLSRFYEAISARGSTPGRPATDPKVMVALWLYATQDGVGSARRLDRLCREHDAYRWICGGVPVNYHTLSDFRVENEEALDDLMTQVLAVMMKQGLVKLNRTAQDGMRVRASAGAASFRREKSLQKCLEAARAHLERVKREAETPDVQRTARERAAQERAAREREERLTKALAELPKAREAKRSAKEREEARVSTTDPEARVMKMGDGGFRPAFNVQLATDTETRAIVGVAVTNVGSDGAQMEPMLADIKRRTGDLPKEHLVDGGFVNLKSIERATAEGVTVYAPVPTPRTEGIDPHQPKEGDCEPVAAWRERMGTEPAKEIYKDRAATAETVNADLRTWRGLDRFRVRGMKKVLAVVLWSALTYNVLRLLSAGGST